MNYLTCSSNRRAVYEQSLWICIPSQHWKTESLRSAGKWQRFTGQSNVLTRICYLSDRIFTENCVINLLFTAFLFFFMQNATIGCMCVLQASRRKGLVHKKCCKYSSKYDKSKLLSCPSMEVSKEPPHSENETRLPLAHERHFFFR